MRLFNYDSKIYVKKLNKSYYTTQMGCDHNGDINHINKPGIPYIKRPNCN